MTTPPPADGPLVGKRVLVTRTREQASTLVTALRERGANPIELPTIQVVPPPSWEAVDHAIENLASFDWIVFTSVNAVRFFFDRAAALPTVETGRRPVSESPPTVVRGTETETGRRPVSTEQAAARHPGIAAIGPATARALQDRGLAVDLQPTTFVAEAVVAELARDDLAGRAVLLPCAQDTRDVLVTDLSARGARVERVVVYQTIATGDPQAARQVVAEGGLDVVTFTSSSTAQHLFALLGDDAPRLLQNLVVASIGPITTATARELGLAVAVEAKEHTIPGLVAALEDFYSAQQARNR